MKTYLIFNTTTKKYYCRNNSWSEKINKDSYFTSQSSKWHKTYLSNLWRSKIEDGKKVKEFLYSKENIVIEEYEMVKI